MGFGKAGAEILQQSAKAAVKHTPIGQVAEEFAPGLYRLIMGADNVNNIKLRSKNHPGSFSPNFQGSINSGQLESYVEGLPQAWKTDFEGHVRASDPEEVADFTDLLVRGSDGESDAKFSIMQAAKALELERTAKSKRTRYQNLRQVNMAEAEEIAARPEVEEAYAQRDVELEGTQANIMAVKERNKLPYGTPGAFKKASRFDSAQGTAVRTHRDKIATAPYQVVEDILGIQGQVGYDKAAGKTAKTANRPAELGFKPENIDQVLKLHQHHIFPNAEGSALMKQAAVKESKAFGINIQRYIAHQYDAALGAAAKNMANIPEDVHNEILHPWLRSLGIEEYWRKLYDQNPDMSPQEILDAVDQYFREIVYPTMVMLENWMAKADPTKFNVKGVHIPKRLLAQAKKFVNDTLETISPTARPGTTAYDVQMDDLHTRAEGGEFGPGIVDSRALNAAQQALRE